MGEQVTVVDVGPRDGLQNQSRILTVEQRMQLVNSIAATGITEIEVGSFVSPKAVPAMAGTDQLLQLLNAQPYHAHYTSLIPNLKGYQLACDSGAKSVTMVVYGSDTMAKKNVGMSRAEADKAASTIIELARRDGTEVIVTIAVAFECPFDGATPPERVADIVAKFINLGAGRVVLADTIGAANPAQVKKLCEKLVSSHGARQLGCHFHDTRGMGIANVYAAATAGIRRFDASIAGMGGCPFAPGATGNVATEDVVLLLNQMGFDTGIDMEKLVAASDLAAQLAGNAPGGRAKPWLQRQIGK